MPRLALLLCLFSRLAVASEPPLAISDPRVLASLEARGLSFGALLFGSPGEAASTLATRRGYGDLVRVLTRDLHELTESDARAGVGMRYGHRAFDPTWLTSPVMRFELVAVVARPDRRAFHPDSCGETRLIYRLAYAGTRGEVSLGSRVPMTVNAVFFSGGEACGAAMRRWEILSTSTGEAMAEALSSAQGPLAPARLTRAQLKSVEVNLQSVRWPSTLRPDLGGHAEYLLRAFTPRGADRLRPGPLENTPDVARLKSDAKARGTLLAWLRAPETLSKLEEGTAVIPTEFLAARAVSVAPHGLARGQNRPFAQLFKDADFSGLPLATHPNLVTPVGLLRRLDGLSCAGCHQSRSIAGFHVAGEEPDGTPGALKSGFSQHLLQDLPRRAAYAKSLLAGEATNERRPHPERGADTGSWGEACGLADAAFASWTCAAGLSCEAVGDPDIGVCQSAGGARVGEACEVGAMKVSSDGRRDAIPRSTRASCGAGAVCEAVAVGFPSGMCAGRCESKQEGATCGAIALLSPFNACLARGRPFAECALHARPAALRACDATRFCREDYLCAKTERGEGTCIPPYFLLQMRVDGHVLPTAPRRTTASR